MADSGTAQTCGTRRAPPAPPGQSPTLAWHYETRADKLLQGVSVSAWIVVPLLLAVLINWISGDRFEWLALGWTGTWVLVVGLVLACGLFLPRDRLAAGHDWFRKGRSWVRTDQLSEVNVSFYTTSTGIGLCDRQGRTVSVDEFSLKHEPEMYRLVIEGVRSSLDNGADANERTAGYVRSGARIVGHAEPEALPTAAESDPRVDRWADVVDTVVYAMKGGLLGAVVSVGMYAATVYDVGPALLNPHHVGAFGWLPVVVLALLRTRFFTSYGVDFRRARWWFWCGAVVTALVLHLAFVSYVAATHGLDLSFDRTS